MNNCIPQKYFYYWYRRANRARQFKARLDRIISRNVPYAVKSGMVDVHFKKGVSRYIRAVKRWNKRQNAIRVMARISRWYKTAKQYADDFDADSWQLTDAEFEYHFGDDYAGMIDE